MDERVMLDSDERQEQFEAGVRELTGGFDLQDLAGRAEERARQERRVWDTIDRTVRQGVLLSADADTAAHNALAELWEGRLAPLPIGDADYGARSQELSHNFIGPSDHRHRDLGPVIRDMEVRALEHARARRF